ncbi:MAG: hypothetical protein ACYC8U_16770 [Thermoleophilia bacterium]
MLYLKNGGGLDVRTEWKDGKRKKLEDQLNDFVAHIYLASEALKEKRLAEERAAFARVERQKREYEEYCQRVEEEKKTKELLDMLDRWRLAREIREFVAEALDLGGEPQGRLEWALHHAESIDPLGKLRARRAEEVEDEE